MGLFEANYAKAINLLNEALEENPEDVDTLTNLGAALCDTGRHEEAKFYLRKAVALGSRDRHTYFNLGVACINTNEESRPFFDASRAMVKSSNTWGAYFDPHGH
jgi:Flp pilus assembly protein TadD